MPDRLDTLIHLLHTASQAALATHSSSLAGYPFVSAVAFCPDAHHRPVLLISRLAEHSRNLEQDSRASLMVSRNLGRGETARATLLGIDRYGADFRIGGHRERLAFDTAPAASDAIPPTFDDALRRRLATPAPAGPGGD